MERAPLLDRHRLVLFGSMLISQQARIVVPWTMRGTGTSSPGMHARSSNTKPIISTLRRLLGSSGSRRARWRITRKRIPSWSPDGSAHLDHVEEPRTPVHEFGCCEGSFIAHPACSTAPVSVTGRLAQWGWCLPRSELRSTQITFSEPIFTPRTI